MPDVSVVLPMYRTATFFPELYRRLVATLEAHGVTFDIVAVDDACPDGSGHVVRAHAELDSRIRLVHHSQNLGQQRTVMDGIRRATGDVVVTMDADLQDEPEDIPRLLEALHSYPVHAAFAGRRGKYQSSSRMLTSRVFKGAVALLLGVPADAGSFVAISRKMVSAISCYDGSNPWLLAVIGGTGLPVLSVPVSRAGRPSGKSSYTARARFGFAMRGLRTAITLRLQRPFR